MLTWVTLLMYDAFKTVAVLADTAIGRLRYHNDGDGENVTED